MEVRKFFRDGLRYSMICTSSDNGYDIIAEYIFWAMENRKKCYYFIDHDCQMELDFYLKKYGLDIKSIIENKSFVFESAFDFFIAKRTYIRHENVINLVNEALEEGYSGVAVISDRDCFFCQGLVESLYEYEKALNSIFSNSPISALCCYNIDKFGVDSIFALKHVNPNFVYKSDNEVFIHNDKEVVFSPVESVSVVYNFLKRREKVLREKKIYEFISRLSREISYRKDEEEIFEISLNAICKASYADYGFVVILKENKHDEHKYIKSNIPDQISNTYIERIIKKLKNQEEILSKVNYLIVKKDDFDDELMELYGKYGIHTSLAIPLRLNNNLYGYMCLAANSRYISVEENSEFLFKISESIIQILEEHRRYKRIQESLIQSRKMQILGEFTGGIAHEFNNVLTPVLGYIQILKNEIDNPLLLRYVEMIEESAKDGTNIVKRIQEFSKARKKIKELVDKDRAIIQAVEITKPKWTFESQLAKKYIDINMSLESNGLVEGVPTEIREIFINLISNAVDAMVDGGIISIKSFNVDNHVTIIVKDSGIGIEKEIKDRIFEPFFTTKNEKGNGLGLSIVCNIIKQMKGTIEVESEVGKGSKFIIKLPLKAGNLISSQQNKDILSIDKLKILVIDDQRAVAQTVAEMLKSMSHDAVYATDDNEAIEKFDNEDFDCVMCDFAMPNYSGLQIAERFKNKKPLVPFILMTGWMGKFKALDLKKIDKVIQKPFTIQELQSALSEVTSGIKKEA
ncbi:hypothetical protein Q428_01980 [Fervidicella metallireducens AeB]|uniref:Stage 0 sporulation protein A homolog n=1 Tax=Fervidicella metallireducens AeB TaxID=1403537 RepID=A0A017RYY8_9CLOT|nr:ATP-binding protein [Fervidicella metallireducens]EYE89599.1 hypothetical protein Q428_01980 [Fervidicella metallireducens AeB]